MKGPWKNSKELYRFWLNRLQCPVRGHQWQSLKEVYGEAIPKWVTEEQLNKDQCKRCGDVRERPMILPSASL